MKLSQRAIASRSSLAVPAKRQRKSYIRRLASAFTLRSAPVWNYIGSLGGSGKGVSSAEQAMQLSAVWSAVKRYSETVGSLPAHMYRWTDNGPERVEDTDSSRVLLESPNAEQTPMDFWSGMQGSLELTGDAIAIKEKNGAGRVVALRMIDPRPPVCTLDRNVSNSLVYRISENGNPPKDYGPDDVLHIRGFSLGGDRGMSPVAQGGRSLGLALNAENAAQEVFKKGLRVSGFVETQRVINNPDERKRLEDIIQQYMGGQNAGGVMLLEGGMSFNKVGVNPIDAELLMTRRFEIEEIGRWFDMPPILLGHAVEGQTMWGSGVDSIVQSWMTLGLRQRLVRNQQRVSKSLLTTRERSTGVYMRYNPDALLAVNSTTRIEVLSKAVQNSLLSPNEARQLQDRPSVPGGDEVLAQVNLVPLDQLGENTGSDSQVRSMLQNWLMPLPGETNGPASGTTTH
ncbi:MAG: phage portal protein [Flavobacteriaceae bacterium]|jgi:HK97 family phage portal protein|nr:phage portal protein [Flavobacteriaceae bacterium]|tara:strand:+ start:346 stop:1713 length:1368 start_codon:yes stop_codon:yes gene_type:complete